MKKIKSFEHRIGWGRVEETTDEINQYISQLSNKNINDVEINIQTTGKGVIYSLIWNE